jgi:hypothetical protein
LPSIDYVKEKHADGPDVAAFGGHVVIPGCGRVTA